MSYTHSEILKQKNFSENEFEGAPKTLKAFFSKLFLWQIYETLEVLTRAVFSSTDLKFGSFITK